MKKESRFELVLPGPLHLSVKDLAAQKGVSLAYIVRNLLEKWRNGEIVLEDGLLLKDHINKDDKTFMARCNAKLLYDFNIAAARYHISRTRLIMLLMAAVVNGKIDLNSVVDE